MGVDVHAVIPCSQEQKIFAVAKISRHLQEICNDKPTARLNDDGYIQFSVTNLAEWDGTYPKEKRQVGVFMSCDSDYRDICGGGNILISLSKWGSAERIIYALGAKIAANLNGEFYYIPNDCKDRHDHVLLDRIAPRIQYQVIDNRIVLATSNESITLNQLDSEELQLHIQLNNKYKENLKLSSTSMKKSK